MNKYLLILSTLLLFAGQVVLAQESDNDRRLVQIIEERGQAEVSIIYPGASGVDLLTRNVSITTIRNDTVFIRLSPATIRWFLDQRYEYYIVELPRFQLPGSFKGLRDWDTYPTYAQYDSMMRSYPLLYPSLCRLDTIGTSINGRLVVTLLISDNVASAEDEPEVFYTSTMHGDETAGFILLLRLIDHLLKNYSSDPGIKELVDNLQIWINPLSNPDGTYRSGNTITSPVRFNANGVDLNRNFPDPLSSTGVRQKETIDMMKFMAEHRFVLSANFHTGEEVVNYPWDRWLNRLHADNDWFRQISRAYADTVHKYSVASYMNGFDNGIVRGAVWYVIYGGRQDYVTWELQGREVTIELDQSDFPGSQLLTLWEYNFRSLLGYLRNAMDGVHGLVLDSNDSSPVPARIFIEGHDSDSSHIYSDTLDGSFVRLLAPGTWTLTFSAKGYEDTVIRNVIVTMGQRTDLTVLMNPVSTIIDSVSPGKAVIFPNPSAGEFYVKLEDKMEGNVNIRIWDTNGRLIADYDDEFNIGSFIPVSASHLAQGNYFIIFTNRQKGLTATGKFTIVR